MKIKYAFSTEQLGMNGIDVEKNMGSDWHKKIFDSVLAALIQSAFPKGVKGAEVRSYNRILNELDITQGDSLELSVADAEFLKKIFLNENTEVLPHQIRFFCLQGEAIEEAFKQSE